MKSFGFIKDKIDPTHYLFGSSKLEFTVLQPDGQWDEYLPDPEFQSKGNFETMNCTVYGTLNCIETLFMKKYKLKVNFSERYVGILSGTTTNGNSPHRVAEVIRLISGLISDADLPFSEGIDSWDEYYSPNPITRNLLELGREWSSLNTFKHEWIFNNNKTLKEKQKLLIAALKTSPIGISVRAWQKKNDLYIKQPGAPDNHWVMLYGYKKGKYWKVFDHYDNTYKLLDWDYDFNMAKRYHIARGPAYYGIFGSFMNKLKSLIIQV